MKRWAFFYIIAGLLLVGALAFAIFRPIQVLPRIGLAPGLALTDQDNIHFSNEDLRGKIVLYNFTYTACRPPCQQTSPVMRAVQDRLGEVNLQGVPVALVTISLDSVRDTPSALRRFGESQGADFSRWRFGSGDATRLKYAVGGGFAIYYAPQPDGSISLDPAFELVDGWGILRADYRTAAPQVDRILRDIRLIAEEVRNSTGAGRYAYEAAHLFLCYPR